MFHERGHPTEANTTPDKTCEKVVAADLFNCITECDLDLCWHAVLTAQRQITDLKAGAVSNICAVGGLYLLMHFQLVSSLSLSLSLSLSPFLSIKDACSIHLSLCFFISIHVNLCSPLPQLLADGERTSLSLSLPPYLPPSSAGNISPHHTKLKPAS